MASNPHDFTRALIADFREHGGHVSSGPFLNRKLVLLTTKGARTGTERTSPLAYTLDGDRIVIIASKGGAPTNPHWYHNLRTHPIVTVELGGETFQARATIVSDPAERRRLYDRHAATHAGFSDYERRTSRVIPVIVLDRLDR